ncbi:uncharacterized protein [Lepeophtheirus salmonis]|uniref:uncharacterized protein isoform X2 n=1 Tax=Lepeophtheirus salmonis TaxID=72036 RepID=UPI003AF3473C
MIGWMLWILLGAMLGQCLDIKRMRPYDLFIDKQGKPHMFNSCPCGLTDYEINDPRLLTTGVKVQKVVSKLSRLLKSVNSSDKNNYINEDGSIHIQDRTKYSNLDYLRGSNLHYDHSLARRRTRIHYEPWFRRRRSGRWKREAVSRIIQNNFFVLNITLDLPHSVENDSNNLNSNKMAYDDEYQDIFEKESEDLEDASSQEEDDNLSDFEFDDIEKDVVVKNENFRTDLKEETKIPDASFDSAPWFATFIDHRGEYVCSGVLVNQKIVLTSSNCAAKILKIHEFVNNVQVIFGKDNFCEENKDKVMPHSISSVQDLKSLTDYEVGLVHLEMQIQFSKTLYPVCLPSQGVGTVYDNSEQVGTHYGYLGDGKDCTLKSEAVKLDLLFPTDLHKICAFNTDSNPCTMNEGGPLTVRLYDRYVTMGIRIQHPACKLKNKTVPLGEPGLYARLHTAVLRQLVPMLKDGECKHHIPTLKELGIILRHGVSSDVKKKKVKTKKGKVTFSIKKLKMGKQFGY